MFQADQLCLGVDPNEQYSCTVVFAIFQNTHIHTHTHTHTHTHAHTHTHTHIHTHTHTLTGLDATSSFELLHQLSKLANSNRTIILTIHQPRPEIFFMFNRLVLLSDGKVIYAIVR